MTLDMMAVTYIITSLCIVAAIAGLVGLFGLFMFIRSKGTRYAELGYGIGGCLLAWFLWESMLYVVKISGGA